MSEQIDWSKAPEWATHALEKLHEPDRNLVYWSFFVDGEHRVEPNGLWYHPDGYRIIQSRPTTPSWSGEGLPPVGTVCELRVHKLTEWSAAKIEFAYRNVIVWDWVGEPAVNGLCTAYAHDVEFRPIRTTEQIEADEREAAIERACSDIEKQMEGFNVQLSYSLAIRATIEAMIDAGYRKQSTCDPTGYDD